MVVSAFPTAPTQRILVLAMLLIGGQTQNRDQFTYKENYSASPNRQYPPKDWQKVRCGKLQACVGWPEKFLAAPDWRLKNNDCQWCPASGNRCGNHHQSPINLERNRAINASKWYNQCIDSHRMYYFDSSCTFQELQRLNAFSIERYALKIRQPIERTENGYRLACDGHRWGRLDYSKGFSNWWWLSHTDFHLPSEHTQEGKRYDVEMQMYHFYSVTAEEAGVPNQMGTVSIFMQAYNDAEDYDVLNKLICQWRNVERKTRKKCGLPQARPKYAGCVDGNRKAAGRKGRNRKKFGRKHRGNRNLWTEDKADSLHDVLTEKLERALTDPSLYDPLLMENAEVMTKEFETEWEEYMSGIQLEQEQQRLGRSTVNYENVPWSNYFGLMDVKTEFYFRYSGTQTVPPCFGVFLPGPNNRANTNHWRVLKDPIRISKRQLNELHRLLKNRVAPPKDPIRPCKPDTAARLYRGNPKWVNMSRPLQSTEIIHYKTFCECRWKSQFQEDIDWCAIRNQNDRFYKQPYNFQNRGF